MSIFKAKKNNDSTLEDAILHMILLVHSPLSISGKLKNNFFQISELSLIILLSQIHYLRPNYVIENKKKHYQSFQLHKTKTFYLPNLSNHES